MRNLAAEETYALEDNGESSDSGAIAVEATVQELADLGAGTECGTIGNTCFKALAAKGYGHRKCRGWFLATPKQTELEMFRKFDWRTFRGCGWTQKKWDQRLLQLEDEAAKAKGVEWPEVIGMFHIKIQTDKTADKIAKIAGEAGGSLRFDGDSDWEGYKVFEIE
jgi:hypothetical protein